MVKPVDRLRHQLQERLSGMLETCVDVPNIYMARGYYRKKVADVMPWTGSVRVNGTLLTIGSWDTITNCLRRGFAITDMAGKQRSYARFEVDANEAKK